MKVLHVTQGYYPAIGGTEILIQRVSEELVRQFGDQVSVLTTNCYSGEAFFTPRLPTMPAGEETINQVQVRRFPVNSRVSAVLRPWQALAYRLHLPGNQHLRAIAGGPLIPGLEQAIEAAGADIIAASSFPLLHMFAAVRAARRSGRACVLHGGIHPQDHWGFDRPMIFQAIQAADHYIANTAYEVEFLASRGISPDKITVIGAGVDVEPFQAHTPRQARQQLGLPLEVPLVGFIGQIGGHKGVDALVKAMPLVWARQPQAHLLLAGARTLFSDHLDYLMSVWTPEQRQKVILRYNFADDEKALLFNAVDVFAYPSGYESFGIAFAEAWAARKPVIGCWRGAVPYVIHPGRDGLLVEFQHEIALAEAILLLLGNPGLRQALGAAGYQKVAQRYNWSEIGRRFRAVYQAALAAR